MAAMLVQMAISRTREYGADRGGAEISGQPMALASALAKISGAAHQIENRAAEANPATAHMFIINPLSGQRMDNLFSTHPDTENRIEALHRIAAGDGSGRSATLDPGSTSHGQRRSVGMKAPEQTAAGIDARQIAVEIFRAVLDERRTLDDLFEHDDAVEGAGGPGPGLSEQSLAHGVPASG